MPTARGWAVATIGVALVLSGLIFGARALEQLGLALLFLVLIALGVVRLGKHEVSVKRAIVPERARAQQEVTVTLSLHNRGGGAAPLLLLEDALPARLPGRSRFTLNGVEPGGRRDVSYTVRAQRRGSYEVGPLALRAVDPFGLARISSSATPAQSFLVHPRTEPLVLPRDVGDRRSVSTSSLRQPTGAQGEDFYALREYVQGDDLRKVHWPSTAKRGKVMIRQEETPWHTRATIVMDDRSVAYAAGELSSFERAIEATASVVELYHGTGYAYRLSGAHHPGVVSARGSAHLHRCLDLLATLQPVADRSGDGLLARLAEMEARDAAEETLVLVTGTLGTDIAKVLGRLRRLFRQIIVVSFPAHRFSSLSTKQRWEGERVTVQATRDLARSGIRCVVLGPGESLASAWASAASGKSRGGDGAWAQKPELV